MKEVKEREKQGGRKGGEEGEREGGKKEEELSAKT